MVWPHNKIGSDCGRKEEDDLEETEQENCGLTTNKSGQEGLLLRLIRQYQTIIFNIIMYL